MTSFINAPDWYLPYAVRVALFSDAPTGFQSSSFRHYILMKGDLGLREIDGGLSGSFNTMVVLYCLLRLASLLRMLQRGVGFALIELFGRRWSMQPAHNQECVP